MSDRLPLPRPLQNMVEKREDTESNDRRTADRRKQNVAVAIERRSGIDQRQRRRRTEERS